MNTLIILYYLLVWSCGLVNLFILAMLLRRDRDPLYRHEFLLMSTFMLLLVLESLPLLVPLADQGEQFRLLQEIIADIGLSLMVYSLPSYINLITQMSHRNLLQRVFLILAAGAFGAAVFGPGLFGAEASSIVLFALNMVSIAYTTGLAVVATVKNRVGKDSFRQENNETLELARRMGIFALVLTPFLIYVDFFDMPLPFVGWHLPQGLHVNPLILLVWSLALLGLRSRSMLTKPVEASAVPLLDGLGFHERYAISPREREVMALLVQGLSYESMADRLCISLSTVKTHINRIYRKTGVNSKVELIHCLQHHNQPESRQAD
jgi:DNA-binding CsgD family transcriptional regulator